MTMEIDFKRGTVRISFSGVDHSALTQPAAWPCIEGVRFGPFEGVFDCSTPKQEKKEEKPVKRERDIAPEPPRIVEIQAPR